MTAYLRAAEFLAQRRAEELLAEQEAATRAFRAVLDYTRTRLAGLKFPLGWPSRGYEMSEILAEIDAWLIPVEPERIQWAAEDAARVAAKERLAAAAEARREARQVGL